MSKIIVHQNDALGKRKSRALEIVAQGLVSPNGLDGQYYVKSQNGNGTYIARVRRVTNGAAVCGCPDTWGKAHLGACKHILAAEVWERAPYKAQELADRHSLNLEALESRIITDLAVGVPDEDTANTLVILLDGCRRLIEAKAIEEDADPCMLFSDVPYPGIDPDSDESRERDYRAELEQKRRPL